MTGEYLGDGLYAEHDGWGVWLRAPHDEGTHEVYLEPGTLRALLDYWGRELGEVPR